MASKREVKKQPFSSGIQNSVSGEIINPDASVGSSNWITQNGRIELVRGREEYGENTNEIDDVDTPTEPSVGKIHSQIFAPRQDGTTIHYRKTGNRIQMYDGGNWLDVIQNLSNGIVFFAPYSSLAGNFLYIGSPDGLFKINVANPRSYKDVYDANKNHKGYILINESRMFLWNRFDPPGDSTALYLSKIDPQGTNYTTVTNEVIATGNDVLVNFSDTLAQATGTRFVFAISISVQDAPLVKGQDDGNGNITGDGVSGTINYATGEIDLEFDAPVADTKEIRVTYQYEDSNTGGLTDFTFSTPRQAGEGDFIPQEYLAEPIQTVIPFDNKYYSFKKTCVYELDLTADDTNANNQVYRTDIGIASPMAVFATGKGIAYIDTSKPDKPFMSMLVRNPVGGNLEPINLNQMFAWENYLYDQAVINTWGEFILLTCRTPGSEINNRLILINTNQKYSVDVTSYGSASFAKENGQLFGGGTLSEVVYQLFIGNDDLGSEIQNFWNSKLETFGDDRLKRFRYLELKGIIDPNQVMEVYASYDDSSNILLGTIRGDASYVDTLNPQFTEVGAGVNPDSNLVGGDVIGGSILGGSGTGTASGDTILAYPFHTRMRVKTPKFRQIKLTFICQEFGFFGIEMIKYFDISIFEQRIPKRYRIKEYVSKDGTQTDLDKFEN
jgi:hypothetical protein